MKSAQTVPLETPSRAGAAMLAVVAAAAGLLSLVTTVPPLEWPAPETEIVLGGSHYRAGPDELGWLEAFTARHFAAGGEAARGLVVEEIDAQLDALFGEADARLPEFFDWYYSLRGEYSRIAMAALAAADLTEPGYVAARAAATLFPEERSAAHLAALERAAAERLVAHYAGVREAWRGEVERRLADRRVPAPLGIGGEGPPSLVLDDFLGDTVAREWQALGMRVSIGTAAAGVGAVAAPVLARAAAVRGGRAAAARTAARGASRVGSAAASGAAVCAPGGPVAAACAVIAGAGAWLVTDWALLEVDERMHREELERAFGEALRRFRAEIERELVASFDAAVTVHTAAVEAEISRSFVPARAGRAGQSTAAGRPHAGDGEP